MISQGRIVLKFFCLFLLFLFLNSFTFGEGSSKSIQLEPVIVTGTRIPVTSWRLPRAVTVIDAEKVKDYPVHSVDEMLKYLFDVRQRSPYGVQADMSIRGAGFEQVLILIDGIKVNDPQTGHHNVDIPLTLKDIERIEILRGHGSSLYGPNAFGGVVNIITKNPGEKQATAELSSGEHGLLTHTTSLSYPFGQFKNRLSFERKRSSGYHANTDFDISSFSLSSKVDTSAAGFNFSFGLMDKDFGADSFYSDQFPNEEEHTKTRFVLVRAHTGNERIDVKPKLYWRRHWDKFVLDRTKPNWYVNYHTTHLYGGELEARFFLSFGSFVLGSEIEQKKITSTGLGDHSRLREAVYTEFVPKVGDKLTVNLGARIDYYSDWGWISSPAFSVGYKLSPSIRLRASTGRSFRTPTFTELYYESPANIGNPDLTPERAYEYEAGVDYYNKVGFWSRATFFRRVGQKVIDWTRTTPDSAWRAENIAKVDTDGVELEFKINPQRFEKSLPIRLVSVDYTYLNSEKENEKSKISKYVLDYLQHQLSIGVKHAFPLGIFHAFKLAYRKRAGEDGHLLLDSRISRKIKIDNKGLEIFIEATNLLNEEYSEVSGVPMPKRWIQAGMKWNM